MTDIIQWAATITGIAAAILVALNLGARLTGWGFVIFAVSSIGWIAFALVERETPLAIQNGVLFCINLIGVYRYWVLKKKREESIDGLAERNDHWDVRVTGHGSRVI
jgi:hypothetical protein